MAAASKRTCMPSLGAHGRVRAGRQGPFLVHWALLWGFILSSARAGCGPPPPPPPPPPVAILASVPPPRHHEFPAIFADYYDYADAMLHYNRRHRSTYLCSAYII